MSLAFPAIAVGPQGRNARSISVAVDGTREIHNITNLLLVVYRKDRDFFYEIKFGKLTNV